LKKGSKFFVLDTSAILAYIEDENGAEDVEELLIKAENKEISVYVPFASLAEVFYITMEEKSEEEAFKRVRLIQSLAVEIIESSESVTLTAGKLKATNRISFADAYVAAVSKELNAVLVHKDPEFENVKPLFKQYKLPYKPKKSK